MARPTMQDIADALSTSRISVWKALNNRPGVSRELREQIIQKARESGYFKSSDALAAPGHRALAPRTVTVVVARPESSVFWMQIIHQIAKELAHHGVNLMYTYLPTYYKDGYELPAALSDGSVAGAIVLNTYSEPILRMLAKTQLPKVFLDTVPAVPFKELSGDLVLLEGRALIREITGRLLDSGRTLLGFVGDASYAQTNADRWHGFLDAHKERGLTCDTALCMTGPLGLRTHYQEISAFLEGLPELPDGFVCASDYIAHYLQRYFSEHITSEAENVALTGFDNNAEYANIAGRITTVDVQTQTMGSRLADKILFAIEHPHASHEVCYVNSDILYRGALAETE